MLFFYSFIKFLVVFSLYLAVIKKKNKKNYTIEISKNIINIDKSG